MLGSWFLVCPAKRFKILVYSPANLIDRGTSGLPTSFMQGCRWQLSEQEHRSEKEGPIEVGALQLVVGEGILTNLKERKPDRLWGWSWFGCNSSGPLASSLSSLETLGLAYSWQNFLVLDQYLFATWVAQPIKSGGHLSPVRSFMVG